MQFLKTKALFLTLIYSRARELRDNLPARSTCCGRCSPRAACPCGSVSALVAVAPLSGSAPGGPLRSLRLSASLFVRDSMSSDQTLSIPLPKRPVPRLSTLAVRVRWIFLGRCIRTAGVWFVPGFFLESSLRRFSSLWLLIAKEIGHPNESPFVELSLIWSCLPAARVWTRGNLAGSFVLYFCRMAN